MSHETAFLSFLNSVYAKIDLLLTEFDQFEPSEKHRKPFLDWQTRLNDVKDEIGEYQ